MTEYRSERLAGVTFATYPTRSYTMNKIIFWTIFRPSFAVCPLHVASASLSEGRQPVTLIDGAGGKRSRRSGKRSRGGPSRPLVRRPRGEPRQLATRAPHKR